MPATKTPAGPRTTEGGGIAGRRFLSLGAAFAGAGGLALSSSAAAAETTFRRPNIVWPGDSRRRRTASGGSTPSEELYDRKTDPDEVHNLIDDPTLRTVRDRLRRALDAHLLEPTTTASSRRDNRLKAMNLSRLVTAMLDARAEPATDTLDHVLAHDLSVHVRSAAAEALARIGRTENGVPWLADTVTRRSHIRVRLQAVSALRNMGGTARPELPRIEQAAALDTDGQVRAKAVYTAAVLRGEQPDIR